MEEEAKKKVKIQKAIKQFVQQIKVGCRKQICFNSFCKKNIFGKWYPRILNSLLEQNNLVFSNDQDLLKFALTKLAAQPDPDDLICSQTKTLSRNDLKMTKEGKWFPEF